MAATLQSLFQLKCIIKSKKIRLSSVSPVSDRQIIALVLSTGSIVLYHMSQGQDEHQVRLIPWFSDAKKEIQSLVFDPVSGGWLLLACYDGTLQILPTLSLFGQKVENHLYDWSLDDITSIPVHLSNSSGNHVDFHPTAVTWWVRRTSDLDRQYRDIAIVGAKCGTVIFVSLRSGNVVGTTNFKSCIYSLAICRNEEASEGNTVLLLVSGESRQQWKVILEHHESGSFWPFSCESKSNSDLNLPSSSGMGIEDPQQATKLSVPSFPSARLRLQGLKQLSVEKLASLRQRLSDGRSRSFNNPPTIKIRGGASVEDSLSRFRSSVDVSDMTGNISSSAFNNSAGGSRSGGPRVLSMSNTHLRAQQVQSRTFLTGYYSPANLLTVYVAGVDMNPVSFHKLCVECDLVLLTDWLIYCSDSSGTKLSVISCRLSECQVTQDKHILNLEPRMDSLVCEFNLPSEEFVLALYRIPAIKQEGCKENNFTTHKSPHKSKRSYKVSGRGHVELYCSELCTLVTTRGVYIINIRPVHEEVLACVKDSHRLEDGERICRIFSLDLQKLLEIAADQQLEAGLLDSGMELYNLSKYALDTVLNLIEFSFGKFYNDNMMHLLVKKGTGLKCRPLKSVLRLAAAGYTQQLLPYATLLLKTADLSPSEQLHLSNSSLLSYTEQTLRAKDPQKNVLIQKFKEFLSDNMQYDEELAVNVVAQSGLCRVLIHLANSRGLHAQVADVLARLLTHYHNQSHGIDLQLTDGFWECMSDELLCEAYVINPDVAHIHFDFVKCKLCTLNQDMLERFVAAFDPSRPSLRPILCNFVKKILSFNDDGDPMIQQNYNIETSQGIEETLPFQEWLSTYLMACLYLAHRRVTSSLSASSSSTSLIAVKTDNVANCISPENIKTDLPTVSAVNNGVILSAGFAHVGLVRNRQLITWGQTSSGCLGVGPNLNRTGNPTVVPLFLNLGLTVYSVACGRLHTLALTDNGVYSWGSSKYGQLGFGKIVQSPQPQMVTKLAYEKVILVEAGQYHSMAITEDGKLWTWGWGVHGQLGHGNVEDQHWPLLVKNLSNEQCISCSGGHAHSLVLTAAGRVWAFGSSVFGQLGTGSNVKSSRPVQVFGLPEQIIKISTAYFHNLALAASNRLYTWGSSPQVLRLQAQAQKRARFKMQQMQSQAEANSAADANCADYNINSAPVSISHDDDFDDDSEGKGLKSHFKMVPTSRFVTLNSEVVVSPSTEMKALPTGRSINEISESPSFSLENGTAVNPTVSLAGLDDGLAHLSPTLVDTSHVIGKIIAINCGCHHSALLTDAGKVHTWGRNLDGQLGNGARTKEALHPTQISIGGPVAADLKYLVCGGEFTLGMEASGKLWAWGSNQYGQLGRPPIEDSTKAGMVLLKTSKRIIKLPHGSLNTADSAQETTGLPPVEVYDLEKKGDVMYFSDLARLSTYEKPAHGLKTLHYALQYFNGLFDLQGLLGKSIELEDWQTAAKLYVLKEQYDQALRYQLKAAFVKNNANMLSSTSESPSSLIDKKFPSMKPDNDNTGSISKTTDCNTSGPTTAVESSSTIMNPQNLQRQESATTIEEEDDDEEDDSQKISLIQSGESSDCHNIPNFNTTTSSSVDDKTTIVDDSSMDELTTSTEDHSTNSEIHTFAVQGGTEEMSTHSQDTIKTNESRSVSDDTIDSRSETPDTLNVSSYCEDIMKMSNDLVVDQKSKSTVSMMTKQKSEDSECTFNKDFVVNKDYRRNSKDLTAKDLLIDYTSVENAYNATVDNYIRIVECYVLHCKHQPVNVLRDLLYQALSFWLEQALPVSSLESFLKEHWDIVHYPLGILLFGQDPADKSVESEKILCRLSTEFSILLCSSMVEHVSDKSRPCPEMMDILAGLSWTSDAAGITTTTTTITTAASNHSSQQTSISVEQSMQDQDEETRLLAVLDELRSPQGTQPYIDIKFSATNSDELTSPQTGEIIAFTCGHRYDGSTSLEKAALGAAHALSQSALPNTANALHSIFQQPQLVRHFACPTCILGCIESELI